MLSEVTGVAGVDEIEAEALKALESAATEEALEEARVAYLGRRGRLTQLLRGLATLPPEQRRATGAAANRAKDALEAAHAGRRNALRQNQLAGLGAEERIDVTLPGWPHPQGGLHPTTRIVREILDVFVSMGFSVVEGPEVEWDRYNFEMLNIPKDPGRDMWNTLWVDYADENGDRPMLLRTHTSPMQARFMENTEPPVRVVVPASATATRPPTLLTSGTSTRSRAWR